MSPSIASDGSAGVSPAASASGSEGMSAPSSPMVKGSPPSLVMATASAWLTSTFSQRSVRRACGVFSYCGLFSVMRPPSVGMPLSRLAVPRVTSGWPAAKPPPSGSFSSVPASHASRSNVSSTGSSRSVRRRTLETPTKESLELKIMLAVDR